MTKSTIARERLVKIKSWRETYGAGSNVVLPAEEAEELASMALVAMDSEPVAYIDKQWTLVYYVPPMSMGLKIGDKLYRHAQPAPVVPEEATPDSIEILASARRRDHAVFQWDEDQRNAAADSWNAFRAAMLQELKKSAGTEAICRSDENVQVLHTKSPAQSDCCPAQNSVTPAQNQGWIPVSERMPESNGMYFGWDGKRVLEVYCFFGGFSANQFIHGEITHWMPLPVGPQEVKSES